MVGKDVTTSFVDGTSIEVIRPLQLEAAPEHVLFDFDGTLSLVREGWPDVMVPMMIEFLRETGTDETDEQLGGIALKFVMELNGKQTIYQMIRLADEIRQRGGEPKEPIDYKHVYHERLMERIHSRRSRTLRGSEARPSKAKSC